MGGYLTQRMRDVIRRSFARKDHPVVLPATGKERGCVAVSYITWPFREGWNSPKARGHTNAFEVVAMADEWRERGFRVEICDHGDTGYIPPADCRVAIDIHSNLERWNDYLPSTCLKVLHATGCHWLPQSFAELQRLTSLRIRRSVALQPRRQVAPSRASEVADVISVLGNEYTIGTFQFSGKRITRIPISSAYQFPWPAGRDFESAKRRFLWLGSYGMVHKGLDLVLEAFATMPDLHLTVCGRPEKEDDFLHLYEKELKNTQNVTLRGWIDMASPEFSEIARTHATIIYPSSSEGGGGAVIHCMHAGLLPACTGEASIDLDDFGIAINDGSVESVRAAARIIASMSPNDVESRARNSWEHVRHMHTRDQFRKNYSAFAQQVVRDL